MNDQHWKDGKGVKDNEPIDSVTKTEANQPSRFSMVILPSHAEHTVHSIIHTANKKTNSGLQYIADACGAILKAMYFFALNKRNAL